MGPDPLSSFAYPVVGNSHPIAGNLLINFLVARQQPTTILYIIGLGIRILVQDFLPSNI